jgi:hypothetical protein
MSTISDKIISIAKSYVGKHEKPGNSGFMDATFEAEMKSIGWYKSASWCAFFAELVWHKAYVDDAVNSKLVTKYCSGNAQETYRNYKASKEFTTSTTTPKVGAILIFKDGNSTSVGHAAVVIEIIDANTVRTIEGNTNSTGGREGVEVAIKVRKLNNPFSATGLNVVGFVYPLEVK